jgi:hypothetical protein
MKQFFFLFSFLLLLTTACTGHKLPPIDRAALVQRNNPRVQMFNPRQPALVGNKQLCFKVDATGLQTFPFNSFKLSDSTAVSIGFDFDKSVTADRIGEVNQLEDLWNGCIESHFSYAGAAYNVQTVCAPDREMIAFGISGRAQTSVRFRFAYEPQTDSLRNILADTDTLYRISILHSTSKSVVLKSMFVDDTTAVRYLSIAWSEDANFQQTEQHCFTLKKREESLSVVCLFSDEEPAENMVLPLFSTVKINTSDYWQAYWRQIGVMDFLYCTDPRARELERRMVYTQYLSAMKPESLPRRRVQTGGLAYSAEAAMQAAQAGKADEAIDYLLADDYMAGDTTLVDVVKWMCLKSDDKQDRNAGFPENGQWDVRWEGLLR